MNKKTYLNSILFSCLFVGLSACSQAQKKENTGMRVMDPIVEVPQWLKTVVGAALPSDSLNIWIPTGDLSTSSLIRVPRFPSAKREEDKSPSPFDIHPVDVSAIHLISGVRNEQQSFQLSVASINDITGLRVKVYDLNSEKGNKLSAEHIKVRYVRYVPVQRARSEYLWTASGEEVFGKEVSGARNPDVVADPLMEVPEVDVPAYRAQPVWFTLEIPESAVPDVYHGKLVICTDQHQDVAINLAVNILPPTLPSPKDYSFFLDLWFNPNAIAVANSLEPWSEEHWKQIGRYLEDLASRGAKTVTTTIVPYPWEIGWLRGERRPQTYTGYPSMVTWLCDRQGNWSFDYTIFDRFVETCFSHGIDRRIDAFSLASFEQAGRPKIAFTHTENGVSDMLTFDPADEKYKDIWKTFLRDFEKHLKGKGWLDKTCLSFDESSRETIDATLDLVSGSAPVFLNQFSIAGRIDTESLARSFSIFYSHLPGHSHGGDHEASILMNRKNNPDKTTTYYLCGEPAHPNSFTYSPAIEARMIPWLSALYGVDGYLRWAYNSWSDIDPYTNPVFNFIQGDDYYIYPGKDGPVSSIRWELLKEGIEDYELLRLIKSPNSEEAIRWAVKDVDGRKKDVADFENARKILLEGDKKPSDEK